METQRTQIVPGARVIARDGLLGTVEEVILREETGQPMFYVIQQSGSNERVILAAELFQTITNAREARVNLTRTDAIRQSVSLPSATASTYEHEKMMNVSQLERSADGDRREEVLDSPQLNIPLVEERLQVSKRQVEYGEVRFHKVVDEVEEAVQVPISHDELDMQRVPVNRPLDTPAAIRTEGEWLVVPVMKEVLVVKKQLMLVEEVRLRTRQVVEQQEIRDTVRRERIEVEDATASTRVANNFEQSRQQPSV